MAAPMMGRNGGSGRARRYQPMAEINVTPFVDVMLVLLIVFMVTAPLLTVGVPVDLPKTEAKLISDPQEPLVISINAKGEIYLQESLIELEATMICPCSRSRFLSKTPALVMSNPSSGTSANRISN